ncbi:unnamed protein product [Clavelina lepadiformis]|uniref:BACK domain-containing protein n=1 Tax=Clavelina lepadiformis TaxID=159417 RepID=A0ABP0G1L2_CLALP
MEFNNNHATEILSNLNEKFFKASLNGENCLKIRSYSNRYNMGDLGQAAETFISKNLGAVLKSGDFLQFSVDDVKAMMKLESVEDSIDEEKYRSAVAWAFHDFDDRWKNFSDLCHLIQLENLSKDFLIKVVQKEKLVCNSTDRMHLLVTSLVSQISKASACKVKPGQSDEILIIGGWNCERSVAKFNTKTIQWSNMTDTNIARRWPSAVNYNQQILLMGGSKGRTYYNSVEMLDLNDENPKWDSNLPSMGEKRGLFASALLDGLVYCAGGYNGTGSLSSCESYHPEERKWSSIRNMNIKRSSHSLVRARALLSEFNSFHERTSVQCFHPGFSRTRNPGFSALFYDSKPGVLKCQDQDIWKNPGKV